MRYAITYLSNMSIVFLLSYTYTVQYDVAMNDVQQKIAELEGKGWSQVAIADEIGLTLNAVQKWKAGARYPANAKAILAMLDQLFVKRVHKQAKNVKHAY